MASENPSNSERGTPPPRRFIDPDALYAAKSTEAAAKRARSRHSITPEVSGSRRIRLGVVLAVIAMVVSTSIGGVFLFAEAGDRADNAPDGTVLAFLFVWSEAAVFGGGAIHLLDTGQDRLRLADRQLTRSIFFGMATAWLAVVAFGLAVVYEIGTELQNNDESQAGLALVLWGFLMAIVNAPFIAASHMILRRWAP